jgi:CRISPR-associated exonuclease Cas4
MNEDYLPLAYLNAWEYCPRRFYLEYVSGEFEDNEHILQGRYLHENVDREGIHLEGKTIVYRHQWVWSDRLQVKGIIDAVEERDGRLIPLEYKKGRMANHLNDHFQVCAAALCLEERTGRAIESGEIFYHSNRRRQRVPLTEKLRQMTEEAIIAAREAANQPIPNPIDHPKKCQSCSLINICLPYEIKILKNL